MKTDSFTEQYKHPKWQKMRLKILERDEYTCRLCKSTEKQLHIHHLEYRRGKKVWEYSPDNFLTLCSFCHSELTDVLTQTRLGMSDMMYVAALSVLLRLWKCPDHEYIVYIMDNLAEQPEMLGTVWLSLIGRKHATKISKAGNNQ